MEDLNKLIADLKHYDPHFRQNAVRSLSQKYLDDNKRNALNEEEKSKIVNGLLSRLELSEGSLEVKGCTVKNFGLISKHLKENEIIQIFSKIITYITDPEAVGKDIYVTCIKAILKEMRETSCITVGKVILPEILRGIESKHLEGKQQSKYLEIKELCFDTFNDYINTFDFVLIKDSDAVIKDKDSILKIAIDTIKFDNPALRNRVSNFLGNFSFILNKSQLSSLLERIINKIKNADDISEKIAYMTTLNYIARTTANRHGEYLKYLIPLIFEICNREYLEANMQDYDLINDLVESGLGLLETYIIKLSNLMKSETEKIINTVLDLMEYDPNYIYSDDNQDYCDYAAEYEGYEQEAFVYGDDSSWKVRRSSIRVIQSFIKSRIEISRNQIENIIQKLVFNLREHEENTKLDLIACLSSFLRNLVIEEDSNILVNQEDQLGLVKQKSISNFIPQIVKNLLEGMTMILQSKNTKYKYAILQLLSSLALVDAADIIYNFEHIKPHLQSALKENTSALTMYVFLTRLLKSVKGCGDIALYFPDIILWIIYGLEHEYYKINIESLNLAYHLIRLMVEYLSPDEFKGMLMNLYSKLLPKFKLNDIDQELKLTLISTIGNLILYMGDHLPQENLDEIIAIYFEKTKNENLRPLVFNWMIKILKNNSKLKMEIGLSQFTPFIIDFLIKNSPLHIQYQTLEFLLTIINYCPKAIKGGETKIIETLLNITNEDSLLTLIFEILCSTIKSFSIDTSVLEKTLIHTSIVLENNKNIGSAINSIFNYIQNITIFLDKSKISSFVERMLDFSKMDYNKAKCIAILAKAGDIDLKLTNICTSNLSSNQIQDDTKKNILMCLGELSLVSNFKNSNLLILLEQMMSICKDDLKSNLSVCIGKVGVSDPAGFVNIIVLNTKKENLTFNFMSIREFLYVVTNRNSKKEIDQTNLLNIFDILVSNANDTDEKLRILCGECLGLISLINSNILNQYLIYLKHLDPVVRATFYYGLKYIFNMKFESDQLLESFLDLLLIGMNDSDLNAKQNAFNSLINFAHNYGHMVRARYGDISAVFKKDHIINPDLISIVDMGAGMKIKNDKGLPIRKAIYFTIKQFLDNIPEKINITETLQMCLYGIDDNDEIQALCLGCFLKIAHFAPEAFISILDLLIDSFKKKINPSKTVVGDSKKLADLVTYINRLFGEIKRVHEIEENPKFVDLSNEIVRLMKLYN